MDKELRETVIARSNGFCQWPQCESRGEEIAHLRSRGMGGNRKTRDVEDNLMWLCSDPHARQSDGEYGSGGAQQYLSEHLKLLGAAFLETPAHLIAYERAEALRELIS